MKYTIVADCKTYSEWEINDNGKPTQLNHEFEGVDVISYKIVPEGEDPIFEHESFEVVKVKLLELTK
jgi:hypothetical protein